MARCSAHLLPACPPARTLQPPETPLRQGQLQALERLGLTLEHSLQDGPLSKQVGGRASAALPLAVPERCGAGSAFAGW